MAENDTPSANSRIIFARVTSRCADTSERERCSNVSRSSAVSTISTLAFGLGIGRQRYELRRRAKKAARFVMWSCTKKTYAIYSRAAMRSNSC